jgi:hypothetical protein
LFSFKNQLTNVSCETDTGLLGGQLAQTADRGADSAAVGGAQRVSATSNGLGTGVATPDADGLSAEGELTAEGAEVLCVLGDLNLLGALTGVRTIAGTVAAHDAHLDGTLSHLVDVLLLTFFVQMTKQTKNS